MSANTVWTIVGVSVIVCIVLFFIAMSIVALWVSAAVWQFGHDFKDEVREIQHREY